MKKIIIILGALVFTVPTITSCESDITSLNVDPKHPDTIPSMNFFTSAQYYLFEQLNTNSVNRNITRYFTQQITETTYTDESNYDMVTRQINTQHWNFSYRNILNAIKLGKEKLEEESKIATNPSSAAAVKNNMWAQMEIVEIYTWANLVDTYNNVPYTEAMTAEAGGSGVLSPKYDDAKTIYADLIKRLDATIAKISVGAEGYQDVSSYKGSMVKWKKLANSLKLRLGVNLSDVDPALAKSTVESAVAGGVITSNADNWTLTFTPGLFASPLYQTVNPAGSGRKDFVAADTLVDFMNESEDPRRSKYFTLVPKLDNDGNPVKDANGNVIMIYRGGGFGDSNSWSSFSKMADDIIKEDAVGDYFDYSEVSFLLAEAAQRGFSVGGTADAFYKQAIQASMDYWMVTNEQAKAYIDANPYDAANWKKSIGEQSWVAMYNRGFEAWTFNRRLDFPKFIAPEGAVTDGVPTRMTYPAPEQSLNKTNWSEAVSKLPGGKDIATAKVFWDKY